MWVQLIVMVVAMLLSYALRPTQPPPAAKTLADVSVPTIEQGTPVAVVFGDVWVDQWFVLWYGDLRVAPIYASGKK
jgi:hypothetical protein